MVLRPLTADVDYARLDRDTLAHIDGTYYLGAHCRKCGHHARLSVAKLQAHLGEGFRLSKLRGRLKCERCGDRKQIVVTLLDPTQRTGNLAHIFHRNG